MTILVTGGAGFIASHVADAYLAQGHDVVAVDNLSTGVRANVPGKAAFHCMDIREGGWDAVFETHRVEVVNHHAAQIDVRRSVADPHYDLAVNVAGSLGLIEAAVRHRVRRFVFASTGGAIYGEQEYFPADERHPTAPLSPYGITKLAVEKYLHYFSVERGLPYTVLRYTNVYGPRQNPHGEAGVVAIFSDRLLAGETPVINGDGLQTRDYVYVGDVVRANLLALDVSGSDIFNVCTGVESTVNDIFLHLNRAAGSPARETHGPAKPGEQRRSVCTFEKIRRVLGWEPGTAVDKGLAATFDWFRARASATTTA